MGAATRYVIVGGSAAGMAAAQAIAETDPGASITVFSAEKVRPYFRPMIPYVISGTKKLDELLLEGRGPYRAGGIDVRLDSPVEAVDSVRRTVRAGGESHPYDRLLLATGSKARIPADLAGVDAEGVYTLRYYSDARGMADALRDGEAGRHGRRRAAEPEGDLRAARARGGRDARGQLTRHPLPAHGAGGLRAAARGHRSRPA